MQTRLGVKANVAAGLGKHDLHACVSTKPWNQPHLRR